VIEISDLTFRYPEAARPALEGIDLTVQAGTFLTLAGLSGSGKSTLLRTLNGLVPHHSGGRFGGTVVVGDRNTSQFGPRVLSRLVGFVFQDPDAQAIGATVEDDIAFSMEQMGVPRPTMRKRVEEMLDLFGLAPLRDREPATLSGGERQRVALAGALALHPQWLVLDEPTSQLDPWGADDLMHALSILNADLGTGIVVAEHRLDRLLGLTERFGWVADGHLHEFADIASASLDMPPACIPQLIRIAQQIGCDDRPTTVRDLKRLLIHHPLPSAVAHKPVQGFGDQRVAARGVTVRHGAATVLRDVDLTAHAGEIVALMGRNGSGKTSLIRALFGFQPVAVGEVLVAGLDMRRHTAAELGQRAAYLPQHHAAVLIHQTLRQEITFTMRQRPGAAWPTAMVESFGLTDLLDQDTRDLSEGERLRAALIAILTGEPSVIFLDEPTRGLDGVQKQVLSELLGRIRDRGGCIVLATHDVELIAALADTVVLLGNGEVVASGSPREVLSGSLAYSTVVNRVLGPGFLTLADIAVTAEWAIGDTITRQEVVSQES